MTWVLRTLVIMAGFTPSLTGAQPNNVPIPSSPPPNTNYIMVLVTNWYDPEPGLRMVNGQIYNPTYAQIWQTLVIPPGAAAVNPTYSGSVQPIDLMFEWGPVDGREHQTVVVRHFLYDPNDFSHVRGNPYSGVVTRHQFALRVLPVDIQTNWTPLGKMWIGQRTYDYGLAYTGKIPVATWQRVPADQAPKQTNVVIRVPRHRNPSPLSSYTQGSFSERLEAIQGMEPAIARDEFLVKLAGDAAIQDDVTTVEQALGDINNPLTRDSAAQMAVITLARAGKSADAYTVVSMITDPRRHQLALRELHLQNQ